MNLLRPSDAVRATWIDPFERADPLLDTPEFRLAVVPDLDEDERIQVLTLRGRALALVSPDIAALPGISEAASEALLRVALDTAGIEMNGADHLFFLPESRKRELLAAAPHPQPRPRVRLLEAGDADAFEEFEAATPEEDLDGAYVELDHWAVYGAFEGDELVAVGSAYPYDEGDHLADLGVVTLPGHRGRGHARAVIRALSRHALDLGLEPQYRCQLDNDASVALAESLGFVELGTWDVPLPQPDEDNGEDGGTPRGNGDGSDDVGPGTDRAEPMSTTVRAGRTLPEGIADFGDDLPAGDPWVGDRPEPEAIEVVPADTGWSARFAGLAHDIERALGAAALSIEHVGSTAVPGLPAKDVIDMDLAVADPADEASYVPALERLGYRLTVREPEFAEHRMLRLDDPRANLHVYGPGAAEPARHRLFRDRLRARADERELYAEAKREAAAGGPQRAMEYNARKTAVVREIYARAFAAAGVPLRERALAPESLPPLPCTARGSALHWRPLAQDDTDLVHALTSAAGIVDHPQDLYSREVIELGFSGERFVPARDAVIALTDAGDAVAFGAAKLGDTAETEVEVFLDGVVHPDWRGLGIGRALLAWQEARGRQLLAAAPEQDQPGMISLGAREANAGTIALFEAAGFLPVRWWMELWRPLAEPIPERGLPEGVTLREYSAELSEATRVAMNDAFRDHWGSQPSTEKEWEEWHSLESFAPELSRLAVVGSGTDADPLRVVAAVLTEVDEEEWALNGGPFAYLSTVGVVRDWRGRGLSSSLISAALRGFRDAGLVNAALDVDAANPSGAQTMYARLGFTQRDRSVTYAKRA